MRVIVAGSRTIDSYKLVEEAILKSGIQPTEIVSGTARGVDRMGELWAAVNGVPVKRFPADWRRNGASAGHIRNTQMAEYAEALVAVWDGSSPGTKHMIGVAKHKGLEVFVSSK